MKVELMQDVSHLLTKGNRYSATRDPGGYTLQIVTVMTVPAEFVREVEYRVCGLVLNEKTLYDVTYRSSYGSHRIQTLRGWVLQVVREDTWSGLRLTFRKTGSRWGGVTRDIEANEVRDIIELGQDLGTD